LGTPHTVAVAVSRVSASRQQYRPLRVARLRVDHPRARRGAPAGTHGTERAL
jgi:hypothetical protein